MLRGSWKNKIESSQTEGISGTKRCDIRNAFKKKREEALLGTVR